MAQSSLIKAGRAFVEIFADDSKLVRGLRSTEKKVRAFGKGLQEFGKEVFAAGSAVVAPLVGAAVAFAEVGHDMAEMAARTGISVEALSELGFAAEMSGADIESLERGIRKMQRFLVEAAMGSGAAQENLALLGLTLQELDGLSPDEQFKRIADRIATIKDPTIRAAMAMEVFGRNGTQLLPMMAQGAVGIERLQEEARGLGLTMSTETATAAEGFMEQLKVMWKVLKAGTRAIGSALVPILSAAAQRLTKTAVTVSNWIKQNKELVAMVFKVAVAVAVGGAAIMALGLVFVGLAKVIGVVVTSIGVVGAVFQGMGAVLAALVSPIGLVISAVVGLGAAVLYVTGAGGAALGWLAGQFQTLKDEAMAAYGGIADALAAGDISLAARILWLTLKMEWQKGTNALLGCWVAFKDRFWSLIDDAVYGGQVVWTNFVYGLQALWAKLVGFLRSTWARFTSWHARTVETTANWIAKRWIDLQGLFDSSINVEVAKKSIDEQSADRFKEIDTQEQADLADIDRRRQESLASISTNRYQRLAEIGQADVENEQRRRAAYDQQLQQGQTELDQARQAWQLAIGEARQKREAGAGPGMPEGLRGTGPGGLLDLEDMMAQARERTVGVVGTFSAMAVGGLSMGSTAERTAKATEETAKNTKRLVDKAGGLTFA